MACDCSRLEAKEEKMELATRSLDRAQALAAVGGDTGFLAELAGILEAACPALLDDIRVSLTKGDFSAAAWSARLLRVAAENVMASNVADAALLIERLARQKQSCAVADAYGALQDEVARLIPVLAALEGEADRLVC
jgi:HPt (histidine-containing phosphotransfer) domain-containing protein